MNEKKQNNNSVYDRYYEQISEIKFNPWISMCTEPRRTIRYIIDNQPRKHVLLLVIIHGILYSCKEVFAEKMGDEFPSWELFLSTVFIGGLGSIALLYIVSGIIKLTGKLLKGKGTMEQIRASMAWSGLPFIFASVFLFPMYTLSCWEVFEISISDGETINIIECFVIDVYFIAFIWELVLQCKSLGEVQGFSAWKAVLNYLLTGIILLPIFAVAVAVAGLVFIVWYTMAHV